MINNLSLRFNGKYYLETLVPVNKQLTVVCPLTFLTFYKHYTVHAEV